MSLEKNFLLLKKQNERLKRENYMLKVEIGRLLDTILRLKGVVKTPKIKIKPIIETESDEEKIYCVCCGEELDEDHIKQTSQTCSSFCYQYYSGDKLTAKGRKIVKESKKTFKRNPDSDLRT